MNQTILTAVLDLIESGVSETKIRKFIREEASLKKSRANEVFRAIKDGVYKLDSFEPTKKDMESDEYGILTLEKNYVYNSEDDKYITFLNGKNIVTKGSQHRAMMKDYINDVPVDQIAIKYSFPTHLIPAYKKAFGWARGGVAITDEEIESSTPEQCAEKLLEEKKFETQQIFHKLSWKETMEDAKKWQEFKYSSLDPFERFISTWNPPKHEPKKFIPKKTDGKYLLIGVSDIHFGLFASERYLYTQKEWSIEDTKQCVKEYSNKIRQKISEYAVGFAGVNVCLMGDLIHSMSGFTDKGTKLETSPLGEEQLEQAFSSMVLFFEELLSIFPEIKTYSVPGNHQSAMDYTLSRMLEIYFRNDPRISFEITSKRFLTFRIFDSLFLMEHGYSAVTKSRLPKRGAGRDNYINNVFLSKPELLSGAKYRYFLSADLHHSESYESNSYEGFMFPTLLGGCRYADNSLYNSRQRQTCLVVTADGVSEVIYFYFD